MDPSAGLGSTAVACARLDVDFAGFDLDDVYLADAVRRTSAITPAAAGR